MQNASKNTVSLKEKYPRAHRAMKAASERREDLRNGKTPTAKPVEEVAVVKEQPKEVPAPLVTPVRRNKDRFLEVTGKTEKDYFNWATQVGQRMHINKLDALVCAKLGLYTVAHLTNCPTALPNGMPENEVDAYLAEHSENPYELAKLWKKAQADAESWVSKESILNQWLTGIRKEDFERWGDPHHVCDVAKKWWNKEAIGLDLRIMELNDMGLLGEALTENDAVEFVKAYKPSGYTNPAQKLVQQIEERFKGVTTFRIKDYYVEHLLKMCQAVQLEEMEDVPF